jgi:lipopolysaccharide heptosyltransferase II
LILITPAIRAIRELHPQAQIALMVGEWSSTTVKANPNIDEIISYPDSWIQNKRPLGYLKLVLHLRKSHFDIAYIFHSHPLIHLLTALAGIPRRYGFYDPILKKQGRSLTDRAEWQPNTDRYIAQNYLDIPRLAGWEGNDTALDFFLTDSEQDSTNHLFEKYGLKDKEFIIVAPGGGVNPRQNVFEKRWGTESYADLCQLLLSEWKLPIVLTGSSHEVDIGQVITAQNPDGIIDLIGKTPFRETAALIKRSRMLLCNDTAVMHVAVVFGVPSLSIFGPSNPRSLLPVSQVNQWITSELECSPCYCNSIFPGCDHLRCMTELSPVAVMERMNKIFRNLKL